MSWSIDRYMLLEGNIAAIQAGLRDGRAIAAIQTINGRKFILMDKKGLARLKEIFRRSIREAKQELYQNVQAFLLSEPPLKVNIFLNRYSQTLASFLPHKKYAKSSSFTSYHPGTLWNHLPPELLEKILGDLPLKDVSNAALVCQSWSMNSSALLKKEMIRTLQIQFHELMKVIIEKMEAKLEKKAPLMHLSDSEQQLRMLKLQQSQLDLRITFWALLESLKSYLKDNEYNSEVRVLAKLLKNTVIDKTNYVAIINEILKFGFACNVEAYCVPLAGFPAIFYRNKLDEEILHKLVQYRIREGNLEDALKFVYQKNLHSASDLLAACLKKIKFKDEVKETKHPYAIALSLFASKFWSNHFYIPLGDVILAMDLTLSEEMRRTYSETLGRILVCLIHSDSDKARKIYPKILVDRQTARKGSDYLYETPQMTHFFDQMENSKI